MFVCVFKYTVLYVIAELVKFVCALLGFIFIQFGFFAVVMELIRCGVWINWGTFSFIPRGILNCTIGALLIQFWYIILFYYYSMAGTYRIVHMDFTQGGIFKILEYLHFTNTHL